MQGAQLSPAAQQQAQTCPQSELLADAQAQAQKLAAAAGLSTGTILSLSQATAAGTPYFADGVVITGNFSAFLGSTPYAPPVSCSLSVQYQLVR